MNTRDLEKLLLEDAATRRIAGGVFACDKLPRRRRPHHRLFIANTDIHTQPGTHWVAFYFTPRGKCVYFDSYGLPPSNKHLLGFVERNATEWVYNSKKLQGFNSKVCGHYCIFFAHHMARGLSPPRLLRLFQCNSNINDCMVTRFVQRNYPRVKLSKALRAENCQTCRRCFK